MSATTFSRAICALLAGYALFGASHARACSTTTQDVFTVGNTATDAACNYGTIQAAVNAATCPAGTRILLTGEVSYSGQQIVVSNKNISLIGRGSGAKCGSATAVCGTFLPCPTAPLQTIYGNIKIRGSSNVTIQYLDVTGGHGVADSNGTTYGGGIDYAGTGRLDLFTSTVEYNTADNGGGIRFQGYGGAADLYLHGHTQIGHNTTTNGGSGGGIRVEGQATLHADESSIWIHDNVADDKGGGIIVIGPAQAQIGSSGDVFFGAPVGVVSFNTANYGGGIALFSNSNGGTDVKLFASDPGHPVRIEHNRAHQAGGGVYLIPYEAYLGVQAYAELELGGAQIDINKAPDGSGVFANTVPGGPGDTPLGGFVLADTGHCADGIECNTISNNLAVDDSDTATAGSTVMIRSYGDLVAQQLAMRGNHGKHAIRVEDTLTVRLTLDTCLLAGNTVTDELVTLGNASATVNQCTIAANSIGGGSVLRANADFTLTNSIIAQGALQTLLDSDGGATLNLDYVLSQETDSLGSGPHIFRQDPGFVDPGNGDFRLRLDSAAVDVAPPVAGDDRDLANRPRDQDLPEVPDFDGDRDLGAFERQRTACDTSDTLYCDGFDGP